MQATVDAEAFGIDFWVMFCLLACLDDPVEL
jgi:hypothetical protein